MLKMCLNWKVLVGLAAVGIGLYLVAPGTMAAAVPILALAACPLSMLMMMKVMHGERDANVVAGRAEPPRKDGLARLKAQQAALDEEIEALKRGDELPYSRKADAN